MPAYSHTVTMLLFAYYPTECVRFEKEVFHN